MAAEPPAGASPVRCARGASFWPGVLSTRLVPRHPGTRSPRRGARNRSKAVRPWCSSIPPPPAPERSRPKMFDLWPAGAPSGDGWPSATDTGPTCRDKVGPGSRRGLWRLLRPTWATGSRRFLRTAAEKFTDWRHPRGTRAARTRRSSGSRAALPRQSCGSEGCPYGPMHRWCFWSRSPTAPSQARRRSQTEARRFRPRWRREWSSNRQRLARLRAS